MLYGYSQTESFEHRLHMKDATKKMIQHTSQVLKDIFRIVLKNKIEKLNVEFSEKTEVFTITLCGDFKVEYLDMYGDKLGQIEENSFDIGDMSYSIYKINLV